MAFGKIHRSISIDDVLNKTTEAEILSYYLNIDRIPCIIKSPLREDKKPSFGLYSNDGIKVNFKDLAKGDRGGTFDLLQELFRTNLEGVLNKVYNDLPNFGLSKPINVYKSAPSLNNLHNGKGSVDLKCKIRNWENYDLEYWKQFGITKQWLIFGDVYPISHIIITKNGVERAMGAEKYAYVYVERKDGDITLKIYQPYSKRHKWSNKHDSSVWDLWEKLPETGNYLIITSSRKDALCIWENVGIPSTSLQAESYLPKPQVVGELKQRFKYVFVLYDNDFDAEENHGKLLGTHLAETYDLIPLFIPTKYRSKDTSDLCKNHGTKVVRSVIKDLILPHINILK